MRPRNWHTGLEPSASASCVNPARGGKKKGTVEEGNIYLLFFFPQLQKYCSMLLHITKFTSVVSMLLRTLIYLVFYFYAVISSPVSH